MSGPDFNPNYCLDYRPPRLQPVIRLLALPAYTRSRVYVTVGYLSVCLSVCPIIRPQQRHAAGLLLSAVREPGVQQQRRRSMGTWHGAQWQMRAMPC